MRGFYLQYHLHQGRTYRFFLQGHCQLGVHCHFHIHGKAFRMEPARARPFYRDLQGYRPFRIPRRPPPLLFFRSPPARQALTSSTITISSMLHSMDTNLVRIPSLLSCPCRQGSTFLILLSRRTGICTFRPRTASTMPIFIAPIFRMGPTNRLSAWPSTIPSSSTSTPSSRVTRAS